MSETVSCREAMQISTILLEKTAQALIDGDFDLLVRCFALPQEVDTFQGKRVLTTIEDLRDIFDGVRLKNRRKGITQMVRHCIVAEFKDPDTIEATHESRNLAGNELKEGPYPVFSVLRRNSEGHWQVASSAYAVDSEGDLEEALMGRTKANT